MSGAWSRLITAARALTLAVTDAREEVTPMDRGGKPNPGTKKDKRLKKNKRK